MSVDDARAAIAGAVCPLPAENLPLDQTAGRVLAAPAIAAISQPPFDASAMDGYAVRLADCVVGARLKVIGESAAGMRFSGAVADGTAVRIFTGAPLPPGADHVLVQEEADRDGETVVIRSAQKKAQNIRHTGLDFRRGDMLADAGAEVSGALAALVAAGNVAELAVRRRPRVALIANGDELALPGHDLGPDDIVSSIPFGLSPMIEGWGGSAEFLGIARDDMDQVAALIEKARSFDLIIPIGGASVGDRDLMRAAFRAQGFSAIFEKVSVKPGKPAWFGRLGGSFVLGLPGNPASAFVTARLFLKPAIRALVGAPTAENHLRARAGTALASNGPRETYLRAALRMAEDGAPIATPFDNQDSSLLSVLARSDVLIRRAANAPPCPAGALADCVRLW